MTRLRHILPWIFLSTFALADEVGIGKEQIKPVEFPKFSLFADYNIGRSGRFLGEDNFSLKMNNAVGGGISFDVGLMKYFNAGAGFSSTVGQVTKGDPLFMRFFLFAKPNYRFNDRSSIYARISGGITSMLASPIRLFMKNSDLPTKTRLEQTYGSQQYTEFSPGVNGGITVGIDYFPFSRFGIALEGGVRTDVVYLAQSKLLQNLTGTNYDYANAPSSIKYFALDFPISLMVHIIL